MSDLSLTGGADGSGGLDVGRGYASRRRILGRMAPIVLDAVHGLVGGGYEIDDGRVGFALGDADADTQRTVVRYALHHDLRPRNGPAYR